MCDDKLQLAFHIKLSAPVTVSIPYVTHLGVITKIIRLCWCFTVLWMLLVPVSMTSYNMDSRRKPQAKQPKVISNEVWNEKCLEVWCNCLVRIYKTETCFGLWKSCIYPISYIFKQSDTLINSLTAWHSVIKRKLRTFWQIWSEWQRCNKDERLCFILLPNSVLIYLLWNFQSFICHFTHEFI